MSIPTEHEIFWFLQNLSIIKLWENDEEIDVDLSKEEELIAVTTEAKQFFTMFHTVTAIVSLFQDINEAEKR